MLQQPPRLGQRGGVAQPWCSIIASAIWSPMRSTGFRLLIGSWNTIAISGPRSRRIASAVSPARSRCAPGAVGEQDAAAGDVPAGMVDQPRDAERRHRLAGTGLADDRQSLALGHVQVEIAHHGRRTLLGGERDAQALDVEQLPGLGQRRILRQDGGAL